MIENRDALIEDGRAVRKGLSDTTELNAELQKLTEEMAVVTGLIERSISTNATTALDQEEYNRNYESLTDRYEALSKRYTALANTKKERKIKADVLSGFLFELGELTFLDTAFNEQRFNAIVDHITVYNDGKLVFTFTSGHTVETMM